MKSFGDWTTLEGVTEMADGPTVSCPSVSRTRNSPPRPKAHSCRYINDPLAWTASVILVIGA